MRKRKKSKTVPKKTNKEKWLTTRHKAITVPVSFASGEPRFLVVRDRRYHDWTFVTGGCRKKEISSPLSCALRELSEETKGTVDIKEGKFSYYFFDTSDVDPKFTFIYHVYLIEVDYTLEEQERQISRFQHEMVCPTHPQKNCYNETDNMLWVTFRDLQKLPKWNVVRVHILDNPDFLGLVGSFNRTNFNVGIYNNYEKQSVHNIPTWPTGY